MQEILGNLPNTLHLGTSKVWEIHEGGFDFLCHTSFIFIILSRVSIPSRAIPEKTITCENKNFAHFDKGQLRWGEVHFFS